MEGEGQQTAAVVPQEVVATGKPDESLVHEGRNARTVMCRICDCCILLAKKATLIEKELDLPGPGNKDEKVGFFWHVTDMYDFENIGFSKTTEDNLKYLTCADCEKGILGIQFQADPSNIYLTTHRVKYEESA